MRKEKENVTGATEPGRVDDIRRQTRAIVVTFQPDLDTLETQFSALADEGLTGWVVDNNSPETKAIEDLATRYSLGFVALSDNLGVAGAQNVGIDRVRRDNGRYVLLLDQDSIPESGAVERLVQAYVSLGPSARVGAVGSSYTLQTGHKGSSFVRFGWFRFTKITCDDPDDGLHEVDFLISSGTFVPMLVLDKVGPMREELFIDHVDTEWFLRAKSDGFRFYGSCAARMNHGLGERSYRVWLGRWRTVPVHRAFRYFFMFRNSFWLYKQEYAPLKWISADVVRLMYIFLFSGILVRSGGRNITWMLKGAGAGLRGIDDPRSAALLKRVKDTFLN